MSQSSASTWRSLESRKRARTSSPDSLRKSQRKRSFLTIKRKYLEINSQSSSESMTRCDTQSLESCSTLVAAVTETSGISEYISLARQYGINVACAKKYKSILMSTPQVPVIRTVSIKLEPISPVQISKSPLHTPKKRGRKPKFKISSNLEEKISLNESIPQGISLNKSLPQEITLNQSLPQERILSQRASRNIRDYFETLNNIRVKQEPKSDDSLEEFENKKVPQDSRQQFNNKDLTVRNNTVRTTNNSQRRKKYLRKSKTEHSSKSHSYLSNNLEFAKDSGKKSSQNMNNVSKVNCRSSCERWKNLIDSSDEECSNSRSKVKSTSKSTNEITKEKNSTLVTNPFSKIKKKSQNMQNLKMKNKSFWKKKFGSDDNPIKRKKKFLQTFMIHKDDEKDDLLNTTLETKVKKDDLEQEIEMNNEAKPDRTTFENCNANDCASIDSLSVNCQYFNPSTIESTTFVPSESCSNSPLLSFGVDPFGYEQNTLINKNVCDSNLHLDQDSHVSNTVENLEKEKNSLNDSVLFLDLDESSTKDKNMITCENPRKKKKQTIKKQKSVKTTQKLRTKPKIISDNKLPNNTFIISQPKKIGPRKLELKVNSVTSSYSDEFHYPSSVLPSKESDRHDERSSNSPPPFESFCNGITKIFTLDDEVTKDQHQSNGSKDIKSTEESFESLCKDITDLTNNIDATDNITLYRGYNLDDENIQQSEVPKCELLHNNKEGEIELNLSSSTSQKSPLTNLHDSQSSLKLGPTAIKTSENEKATNSLENMPNSDSSTILKSLTFKPKTNLLLNSKTPAIVKTQENTTCVNKYQSRSSSCSREIPITFQAFDTIQENKNTVKLSNNSLQRNLPQSEKPRTNAQESLTTSHYTSSQTHLIFVNDNSRLNSSVSSTKLIDVNSRDPRLNRSNSPFKSSVFAGPKVVQSSNIPYSSTSDNSMDKIPDPRLRKKKEREDAEKVIQLQQNIHLNNQTYNLTTVTDNYKVDPQQTLKKKSVFERLGRKSLSPKNNVDLNKELTETIDGTKHRSNDYDDSDDEECISIHPVNLFSSDEEPNASPPHRKFTSERMRINDENKMMPASIKDRLSRITSNINKQKQMTGRVINRITFDMNANKETQPRSASTSSVASSTQPKISGMSMYASHCRQIPLNVHSNNDYLLTHKQFYKNNCAALNDNFYTMNAVQMLKDVDDFSQTNTIPSVTFGNDNLTFFKSYCFRILRNGNCVNEMTTCNYSHHIRALQDRVTLKRITLLLPILDSAINQKFGFFLQNVWSSILPVLEQEAFNVYNKLYQAGMRSERFLNELLDYCINMKLHSVESFVKKIALYVNKGNKDWVRNICIAIKGKLADGFCWETIKCLSQKAVPPVDMIELTILQCLKRKKNPSHINEVYDLVKNKINNLERDKMSQSMLQQFYILVQKIGLVDNKEALNTIPLTNPTPELTEKSSSPLMTRSQSTESIRSMEMEKHHLTVTRDEMYNVQQPNNSPVDVRISTPNNGEIQNFSEYIVKEVDSSEPKSPFRKIFWQFYLMVNSVNEGLDHEDYDYVWTKLQEFSKQNIQDSLLKRAYYHILCKKVKSCERYLSEIIKRAGNKKDDLIDYLNFSQDNSPMSLDGY